MSDFMHQGRSEVVCFEAGWIHIPSGHRLIMKVDPIRGCVGKPWKRGIPQPIIEIRRENVECVHPTRSYILLHVRIRQIPGEEWHFDSRIPHLFQLKGDVNGCEDPIHQLQLSVDHAAADETVCAVVEGTPVDGNHDFAVSDDDVVGGHDDFGIEGREVLLEFGVGCVDLTGAASVYRHNPWHGHGHDHVRNCIQLHSSGFAFLVEERAR